MNARNLKTRKKASQSVEKLQPRAQEINKATRNNACHKETKKPCNQIARMPATKEARMLLNKMLNYSQLIE